MSFFGFGARKLPNTGNLSKALKNYISAVRTNETTATINKVKRAMNALILSGMRQRIGSTPLGASIPNITKTLNNLKNEINDANQQKLLELLAIINNARKTAQPGGILNGNNAKSIIAKANALSKTSINLLNAAREFMTTVKKFNAKTNKTNINYNSLKTSFNKLSPNLKKVFQKNYNNRNRKNSPQDIYENSLETHSLNAPILKTAKVNGINKNIHFSNKNKPGLFVKTNNGRYYKLNSNNRNSTNYSAPSSMQLYNYNNSNGSFTMVSP